MNTSFPKSKEKRSRPSSERNKSFVKNVTSRMSGLLPATITKWFSSPSSSNTNGSTQVADATDSSTEDEAPESPIPIQPPAKRMRYTSPGNINQHVQVETKCASTNTETINESSKIHSPTEKSSISRDNNITLHSLSTKDDSSDQNIDGSFGLNPQSSFSVIECPKAPKRKSLFGSPPDKSYKPHSSINSNKMRDPYFKPSLLSSPFYVGRTMYGGASSSYVTPISIKRSKISVTNETSNDNSVTMSHSARRVMDLLEHYSSPLTEAKRIPQITRDPKNRSWNYSLQGSVNPYRPTSYSYKSQELHTTNAASILTIKRKARLMDTTNAARQIIASHSSSSPQLPFNSKTVSDGNVFGEEIGIKYAPKIKSRLTRINRGGNIDIESNDSEIVNLPNVVLQIDKDNLPKFTFGPMSNLKTSGTSSLQTLTPEALKKSTEDDMSDLIQIKDTEKDNLIEEDNSNDSYQFSRPVEIVRESKKSSSSIRQYDFGSPERNVENNQEKKNMDDQLRSNNNDNDDIILDNKVASLHNSANWKCLDCFMNNKTDAVNCICCGGNKPIKIDGNTKKCCVCNLTVDQPECKKCTECYMKSTNIDDTFVVKEAKTTKWKCSDCWVENNESADKCVCCGGKNPKKSLEASLTNIIELISECEWKCNNCWIKNNIMLPKCAACGEAQPGSSDPSNNELQKCLSGDIDTNGNFDSKIQDIKKSQSEKWECPICLVRNESNRATCSCCEANKPGIETENFIKFNFHQPSEITFKFGIQPKYQETSTDIALEESNMSEESETNNNILPKTTDFNFGFPGNNTDNVSKPSLADTVEAPKINFTFGVKKREPVLLVRSDLFGIPNKQTELIKKTEEKEDLQEVPQIFTSVISSEPFKKNLSIFSTPSTSQVASEIPALVPLQLVNQSSGFEKDIPFSTTSTANSDEKSQQNHFAFSTISPASNMFGITPTTTTASSSILTAPLSMGISETSTPLFQKANNVTTTTASFFQKSDSLPNISISKSLFSKTESITTTTSTATMSIMPVFSFSGSQPQAEKPKFNFNFTGNNTESGPNFKPPFGGTESTSSTNQFTLPSNSIIGGNMVSGNQINSTTPVNVGNAMTTGNSMSTPSVSSMFGTTIQKDNMWSSSTNSMFATNTTSNAVQNPPTFTFGTTTSFSPNNVAFGSTIQQVPPAQPSLNVFGIANQTNSSVPTMFGNNSQNQAPATIFGSPQVPNNPMPMGIFGPPNATPSFGVSNSPISTFEAPPVAPAPASFNFGGQPSNAVFGFGQQQQQAGPQLQPEPPQQPGVQQPGMYSFGGSPLPVPQMQFNIGSSPAANVAARRVRRAVRRTQR